VRRAAPQPRDADVARHRPYEGGVMDGSIVRLVRTGTSGPRAVTLACLLLTALAGSLAACGGTGDGAAESFVFIEADSGRAVEATVGDTIAIRLSENPSTGYSWSATSSDGLQQLESRFATPSVSPALVGAPGTRVFTYEVRAGGRQSVEAIYARSWETGASRTAGRFSLTIDVE
jgi:inhibitor of cysteine peptidase